MIPKSERDQHRTILAAATPLPWRWWTSNSMRRLSSCPTGKDGDVAHAFRAADGVPDIAIREADMMAIETTVNAIGRYIADAEETERRIAMLETIATEYEQGKLRPPEGLDAPESMLRTLDATHASVMRMAAFIMRGGQ